MEEASVRVRPGPVPWFPGPGRAGPAPARAGAMCCSSLKVPCAEGPEAARPGTALRRAGLKLLGGSGVGRPPAGRGRPPPPAPESVGAPAPVASVGAADAVRERETPREREREREREYDAVRRPARGGCLPWKGQNRNKQSGWSNSRQADRNKSISLRAAGGVLRTASLADARPGPRRAGVREAGGRGTAGGRRMRDEREGWGGGGGTRCLGRWQQRAPVHPAAYMDGWIWIDDVHIVWIDT